MTFSQPLPFRTGRSFSFVKLSIINYQLLIIILLPVLKGKGWGKVLYLLRYS